MNLNANIKEKANLIWAIADKLTGVYKPHEYGKVILPLIVIRRFSEFHNFCNDDTGGNICRLKLFPARLMKRKQK